MNVSELVRWRSFRCEDVARSDYAMPGWLPNPDDVAFVMVSEAPPADPADWFYAGDEALFARTTVDAFRDAGEDVESIQDVLDLGVYLTRSCSRRSSACSRSRRC
jgi:uracil-DNA glycosylase